MRKAVYLLLTLALFACNDQKGATSGTSEVNGQDTVSSEMPPPGNIQKERDALQTEKAEPQVTVELGGRYRKITEEKADTACNCDCIEIDFDKPTEWCIDKDKLYITAQTRKTGENTAEVYFVSASREISPDRAVPWDDFDTDTPVATISFNADGSAELDWLGFATNGEVATEYALYGKKTLEGTYKKE